MPERAHRWKIRLDLNHDHCPRGLGLCRETNGLIDPAARKLQAVWNRPQKPRDSGPVLHWF